MYIVNLFGRRRKNLNNIVIGAFDTMWLLTGLINDSVMLVYSGFHYRFSASRKRGLYVHASANLESILQVCQFIAVFTPGVFA